MYVVFGLNLLKNVLLGNLLQVNSHFKNVIIREEK